MPPLMGEQGGASLADLLTKVGGISAGLSQIYQALSALLPRIVGTFTLAAAATTTVAQPGVKGNSVVQLTPTNAAAATLMGSAKSLYPSVLTPGTGFTVATASGAAAAGTETFSYVVINPA